MQDLTKYFREALQAFTAESPVLNYLLRGSFPYRVHSITQAQLVTQN